MSEEPSRDADEHMPVPTGPGPRPSAQSRYYTRESEACTLPRIMVAHGVHDGVTFRYLWGAQSAR